MEPGAAAALTPAVLRARMDYLEVPLKKDGGSGKLESNSASLVGGIMPRPKKCRKVCCLPRINEFLPAESSGAACEVVIVSVDEYEAVRLIDHENFSQEECSGYMGIARTTVQQIYDSARKKIARALVEGLPLKIEGGDYRLCDGNEEYCGCGGCRRHRRGCMCQERQEETK